MKEFALNEEDMQSLKISLLAFVRRIAFQSTTSEEEAGAFFLIVNLLLGNPMALELNLDDLSGRHEEAAESDGAQESENSGSLDFGEGCSCALSCCEKRCPSFPKKDILNF